MRLFSLISAIAISLFIVVPASARKIEDWPYDRLFKEAALVVIARAGVTADTPDRLSPPDWNAEFIGQETPFIVESIVKGKFPADKKLTVFHYRLLAGVLIDNGPLLVKFRNTGTMLKGTINGTVFQAELVAPEYLLFLHLRADGRYEPVSGQIDPVLSIRELHSTEGFLSGFDDR